MSRKRFRDLFGRRADIDEQRRIVRDQPRRGFSNQSLLVVRDELPGLVGEVFNSRSDDCAAMNANHRPSSLSSLRSRLIVCKATLK